MKPRKNGIVVEGICEMHTASSALRFAVEGDQFPKDTKGELELLATGVDNMRTVCEGLERLQGDSSSESTLTLEMPSIAELTVRALQYTMACHPDELIAGAARDMHESYQAALHEPPTEG